MVVVAETISAATSPLLTVKHAAPPAQRTAVLRQRLLDLLTETDAKLGVVVAPAGWGKTTLLAQWVEQVTPSRQVAWLSLDESDNDPGRFWAYLLGSLVSSTGIGTAARQALTAPGEVDPVRVLLPLLVNELAGAEERLVLILDDYHTITDRGVHEGVEFLLSYLPPSLLLVLASRADPPLPLARLRARQQLVEVRGDDLRFTAEESAALLASVATVPLSQAAVSGLWQRTEGWAAGLQLAALALRGSAEPSATAAEIRGDDRHILDYLTAEVLTQTDPGHRDFLVRTSVLPRLSGPLCDAVLQLTGSGDLLLELARGNLFVTALDRRGEWFRCHGLFRDVLRRELERGSADLVPQLFDRAASWYADADDIEQAARCELAAGDPAAAIALLRTHEDWFFERGAASAYLELGEHAAAGGGADPQVFLMLAYAAALTGRFDRAVLWCDNAEKLVDDTTTIHGWHSALASVLAMRAAYGHIADGEVATALSDARRAVQLETDPAQPGYVVSRVALGSTLMRSERFDEAADVLLDAWDQPSRELLPTPVVLQAAGLFALVLLGQEPAGQRQLDRARSLLAEVSARADGAEAAWGDGAAAAVTWVRLAEGRLAYRSGDLEKAARTLRRAAMLADSWGRSSELVMSLTSLAEAELGRGDRAAARDALTRAREVAEQEPVRRAAVAELEALENRVGRGAARAARRLGHLDEELTDRELSILRALVGSASNREIGNSLFLSVNTVKGYIKSLYRKLGAASRADAVERGRSLGLI